MALPALPFEWWEQFRLEQKFGFNKSTAALWVTDKVKGTLLLFAIGYPLLWALLWVVEKAGASWWIWGFERQRCSRSLMGPPMLRQCWTGSGKMNLDFFKCSSSRWKMIGLRKCRVRSRSKMERHLMLMR